MGEGKGGQQVLHPLNVFEQVYRLLAHIDFRYRARRGWEMGISNGELENGESTAIQPSHSARGSQFVESSPTSWFGVSSLHVRLGRKVTAVFFSFLVT